MRLPILLIVIFLLGCKNEIKELDINGHWHLYSMHKKMPNSYLKLDIKNDSVAIFEGVNIISFGDTTKLLENARNIDEQEQIMTLWTEGMYDKFKYNISNDTLHLESIYKHVYFGFYGIKKDEGSCDYWEHFSSERLVKIELPEKINGEKIITNKTPSFSFDIYMGLNKETGKTAIEVGEQLVELEDLALGLEQQKTKIFPYLQDSIYPVIYMHKELPTDLTRKVINQLKSVYSGKIYEQKITRDKKAVLVEIK